MLSGFTSVPRKFLFRERKESRTGSGQEAMTRAPCCNEVVTFLTILLLSPLRVKTVFQYLPVVCRHQLGGQPISQPADRTDPDQLLLHGRPDRFDRVNTTTIKSAIRTWWVNAWVELPTIRDLGGSVTPFSSN